MRTLFRSLRYKVPLVIFLVFLAAASLLMVVLTRITIDAYAAAETASVTRDTQRTEKSLRVTEDRLAGNAADWAEWTEAYDFVAGHNPDFTRENVVPSVMRNFDSDFLVIFSSSGEEKYAGMYVPGASAVQPLSPDLRDALASALPHLRPSPGLAGVSGLVLIAGKPTLFASHPITNNDVTAAPNGFLLLGRFVDVAEAHQVEGLTGLSVTLTAPETPSNAPTLAVSATAVAVAYPDSGHVTGTMLLAGVDGVPALHVAVSEASQAEASAHHTLVIVGWALFGFVVLFGAALAVALQTTVLRRLTRLHERTLSEGADRPSAYSTVGGEDEITDLALALDDAEGRALRTEAVLRHEADHDPLTGLSNRRCLERDALKSIAEAGRIGGRVALALLDLDGFKAINDVRGHVCGDQVLVWFGEKAQAVVRGYSTVARTGGDEFAILLPQTDFADATRALARLTESLAVDACRCGDTLVPVSACTGIAVYPDDARDFDELLRVADERMYVQKRSRQHPDA